MSSCGEAKDEQNAAESPEELNGHDSELIIHEDLYESPHRPVELDAQLLDCAISSMVSNDQDLYATSLRQLDSTINEYCGCLFIGGANCGESRMIQEHYYDVLLDISNRYEAAPEDSCMNYLEHIVLVRMEWANKCLSEKQQ